MEHSENAVILRGELLALPQFSHENHRKRFYRFTLAVPRLSGTVDYLPVVAEVVQPAAEQCCPLTRRRTGAAGQRTWTVALGGGKQGKSSGASQIVQKSRFTCLRVGVASGSYS